MMNSVVVTTLVCSLLAGLVIPAVANMKIAAFNVQVFGKAKVGKPEVVATLVKIIQRYDIILVQEVRDSSGTALQELMKELNKGSIQYTQHVSARLGRTHSKEQYAFIYRKNADIKLVDTYQYEDKNDKFEREPLALKFRVKSAEVKEFALVGIHIDPDVAPEELDAMVDVHDAVKRKWDIDDILLMGDMNAACSYVSKSRMKELHLRQPEYHWLTPDTADTSVGASKCAYDRFIMTGQKFLDSVVENSVKVFNFDQEYGLTYEEAKLVSDHYPIELALKNKLAGYKNTDPSTASAAPSSGGFFSNIRKVFRNIRKKFEL